MSRDRRAVSVAFLAFGAVMGSWIPRLPAVKEHLRISDGQVGYALLAFAVGAVIGAAVARGEGLLHLGDMDVKVKPRRVSDPAEARASSALYTRKYGETVKASKPDEPLTPGEVASFELLPVH